MNNVIQLPTKDSQIEKLTRDLEVHQRAIAHHMRMSQRITRQLTELYGFEVDS